MPGPAGDAAIAMNRLLDRAANFRISEKDHGTAENLAYEYDPTFIMRGLSALHIEFDPIS